eukprot:14657874-Alexandrium_andersonii.AAC.1
MGAPGSKGSGKGKDKTGKGTGAAQARRRPLRPGQRGRAAPRAEREARGAADQEAGTVARGVG